MEKVWMWDPQHERAKKSRWGDRARPRSLEINSLRLHTFRSHFKQNTSSWHFNFGPPFPFLRLARGEGVERLGLGGRLWERKRQSAEGHNKSGTSTFLVKPLQLSTCGPLCMHWSVKSIKCNNRSQLTVARMGGLRPHSGWPSHRPWSKEKCKRKEMTVLL